MNPPLLLLLLLTSLAASQTHAKAVFAHFMVGNVGSFTITDWENDMSLAASSSIDAFALNIASNDTTNTNSLSNAFKAANNKNFKLFFSFDYAATGPWHQTSVISLLTQYGDHNAYWKHNNKPLVSTFEGGDHAADWNTIKSQKDCFFIPDYTSLGAQTAFDTGVADGLFSWDAWPVGPATKTTDTDKAYKSVLKGRPYMMPVSPWFYTNLPGFGKNWLWRGDGLWNYRWRQVLEIDPEFVQIISWNDYGESHYIGPLHESEMGLFSTSSAPLNYAREMGHDGWRKVLPFVIGRYRDGVAGSVGREVLVVWYRVNPGSGCMSGGTRGGSENNGERTYDPNVVSEDRIFYSALLSSPADVGVTVGGGGGGGGWEEGSGEGIYYGSVGFGGRTGEVSVSVVRGSDVVLKLVGRNISSLCEKNMVNWNAWVGSS